MGGTQSGRRKGAVENLGLVTSDQAGKPNGPVLLDELGVVARNQRPAGVNDPSAPSLNGPLRVYATTTSKYFITNYNSNYYSVSVTGNNGTSCSLSAWTTSPFGPFNSVIQVRYQDKDGYWSNWSAPVTISVYTESPPDPGGGNGDGGGI